MYVFISLQNIRRTLIVLYYSNRFYLNIKIMIITVINYGLKAYKKKKQDMVVMPMKTQPLTNAG